MHGTRRERDAVAREARVWLPVRADEVGCEVNLGGGRGRRSRRTRRSSELWLADIIGYQEWGWQADGATVGTGLGENRKVYLLFSFHPINPVNKKISHRMFRHMHGVLNEIYL